jgi:nitroreductase
MSLKDLIAANRTCRRFYENEAVTKDTLRELIDLARLSPSGANLQSLKYIIITDPAERAKVFATLGWAGYLTDWPGPPEGERPAAYIVILADTEIAKNWFCDQGIAAQSIMLGAREKGLGGCMHGGIKQAELREALALPARYELLLVLSIGKPREEVVLEELPPDGSVKYWRDENGVHHVPKRSLDDIILR